MLHATACKRLALACVFLIATAPLSAAHAAGFQLKEQSARSQGLSFAGATAVADDPSTLFFNPAGITQLPDGTHVSGTASLIAPSAKFNPHVVAAGAGGQPTIGDSPSGDIGVASAVPALYASTRLGERLWGGISVNTPFGLSTHYHSDWMGRYYALESKLVTINVAPALAYKVNDQLSVGANVQVQYALAKLTNAVNLGAVALPDGFARLRGDDISYGFGFGALWTPRDDTRIGLNYRSRITHHLNGNIRISTPAGAPPLPQLASLPAAAKVTTPDILSLGIAHDISEKTTLMADVAWTNWSLFERLRVVDANGTVRQDVHENWHDTIFAAVGFEHRTSPQWTFRAGTAFDQGAVKTEDRTFRIPESDRIWVSAGASYNLNDATQIDLGFSHLFTRGSRVNESSAANGTVDGSFDSHVNILSIGTSIRF